VAVSSIIAKFWANFLFIKKYICKKRKDFLENLQIIRHDYLDISRQTYATIKIFIRTDIASTALIFLKKVGNHQADITIFIACNNISLVKI
jgi:hypothetical protein